MAKIDVTHCWVELALGGRFKRSLRRHLREWLFAEIESRGYTARDQATFNQDPIEDQVDTLEAIITDSLKTAFRNSAKLALSDCSTASLSQWLARALDRELSLRKSEFLADEIFGLSALIDMASLHDAEAEPEAG